MFIVRLAIFGLFFYLVYFLVKFLFIKPFQEGYKGQDPNRNSKRGEGKITIDYDPRKGKNGRSPSDIGEYIDYEEVKDEEK